MRDGDLGNALVVRRWACGAGEVVGKRAVGSLELQPTAGRRARERHRNIRRGKVLAEGPAVQTNNRQLPLGQPAPSDLRSKVEVHPVLLA